MVRHLVIVAVAVAALGCGGTADRGKNSGKDKPLPDARPAEPEKK